jgi:hypothetical protein
VQLNASINKIYLQKKHALATKYISPNQFNIRPIARGKTQVFIFADLPSRQHHKIA